MEREEGRVGALVQEGGVGIMVVRETQETTPDECPIAMRRKISNSDSSTVGTDRVTDGVLSTVQN